MSSTLFYRLLLGFGIFFPILSCWLPNDPLISVINPFLPNCLQIRTLMIRNHILVVIAVMTFLVSSVPSFFIKRQSRTSRVRLFDFRLAHTLAVAQKASFYVLRDLQYVGRTTNLRLRLNNHKCCIANGRVPAGCFRLYEHFTAHSSFFLTIVHSCTIGNSDARASHWINELKYLSI